MNMDGSICKNIDGEIYWYQYYFKNVLKFLIFVLHIILNQYQTILIKSRRREISRWRY